MDSNAYAISYHESGDNDMAPALSLERYQDWRLMVVQSPAPPETETQNLDVYQTASLSPSLSLTQHALLELQEALTQRRSETLDDSYIIKEQSGHFQEDVTVQIDRTPCPSEDDWEQHRPKIIDLYRKMPLKDLMATMKRDHSFKASTKMYKDRIRKWQIDKKIKGHEMKAIIRKQAQRSRAGKKSLFYLRNSQVPQHKVTRYRKAMQMLSEEQALMLRAETPPGLICYTPPASPLTTPEVLEIPERIAKLVQDYIGGSFDSGTWIITECEAIISAKGPKSFIYGFNDQVRNFVKHFQRGETSYAWRILRMAMTSIANILSAQHPSTLDILAFILLETMYSLNSSEVAVLLLKQFSAMSAVILPKQHPLNQVFARLVRLDRSHLSYTLIAAKESQSDGFARRSGRFNWNTLETQLSLLELKYMAGVAHTTEGCLTLLQAMELALDTSDPRLPITRNALAARYLKEGDHIEAAETAQSTIDLAAQTGNVHPAVRVRALHILSCAQYELSMTTLAEQNLRQAIHIQATCYGWENGKMLDCMSHLGKWLESWGRLDDAAQVRRERDEILDSMEERIIREEEERCQRLGITEPWSHDKKHVHQ